MSFLLSEDVHASQNLVYSLLTDVNSIKQYNPNVVGVDANHHGKLYSGRQWSEQVKQLYLRHHANFHCLAADETAGVVQYEMDDGFHIARYTWLLRPLRHDLVRIELRVDCSSSLGGVVTPSEQLASMLKRDDAKTIKRLKTYAEQTWGSSGAEPAGHFAARELLAW